MSVTPRNLIVVGQGAAGLAAALSAADEAHARLTPIRITLIDKAPEDEAGGNTSRVRRLGMLALARNAI